VARTIHVYKVMYLVLWLLEGFWIVCSNWYVRHSTRIHNTALSLICILYKTLGHAKSSLSSLVLTWQGIYKGLAVTAENHDIIFAQPNSFLAISSHLFCQLPTPETLSILCCNCQLNWLRCPSLSFLYPLGTGRTESTALLLLPVFVYTETPLLSCSIATAVSHLLSWHLLYYCAGALRINGCFSASTVLALSKYATINICTYIHTLILNTYNDHFYNWKGIIIIYD
jgi:hypothetical protein